MNLDSVTSTLTAVPADWMLLGALAILAALDCLRSGARRISQLALALPPTMLMYTDISNTLVLEGIAKQLGTPLLQAVLFFLMLALMYVLVSRIGLSWGGESRQTTRAALAGVAGVAIIVVFWLQIPALDSLWHFGGKVQEMFGESYRLWWLVGAYATLAFVRT